MEGDVVDVDVNVVIDDVIFVVGMNYGKGVDCNFGM